MSSSIHKGQDGAGHEPTDQAGGAGVTQSQAAVAETPATYREVFAPRAFRYLLASRVLSLLGDMFLRVALALLVFQSSHSPLLTALAYAMTFLPWVVGGPALGVFADRVPRRTL